MGRLTARAGAAQRLEVNLEDALWEVAPVGRRRHLGNQRPSSIVERLPGLAVAIGAVADALVDRAAGGRLGLLDQLQRSFVVLGVPGQHAHRRDQLLVGVDGHGRLVPVEPLGLTLRPMPLLRVVHRQQPIIGHPLPQVWAIIPPLDVLDQHPAQQPGRLDQRDLVRTPDLQGRPRLPHQRQQPISVSHQLAQHLPPLRASLQSIVTAPLKLGAVT